MPDLAINGGPRLRTEPFVGWPPKDPGFKEYLAQVIDSGAWGIGGAMQERLLQDYKKFCDAEYAVLNTNGTFALELGLRALGVGPGDEVIVPPYTFIATASSVVSAGAIPVFADIRPDTLCLDAEAVEAAITPRTAAVTAVHIGGMPADMDALKAVCAKHGLKLLEDCAQAHGAVYRGRKVGAIGDAGGFSFQSSKNLTAGEGGLTTTNDGEVYARAWSYANLGRVPDGGWYDHRVMGTNLRMTDFQAAVLVRGIEMLEEQMARRDLCANHLRQRLEEIEGIEPQAFSPGAERCAYHLFIFRYDRAAFGGVSRDRFVQALAAEGIPVSNGYNPLYREGLFANNWSPERCPWACKFYEGTVDYSTTYCPVAEHVCTDGSFWMGQSPFLGTTGDMDDIADAILKVRDNLDELRD
ncbi:MAG: DegT/DnrJ/EryC1/StrS family aminotransferase [Armatimonadetes bacterium]|nr:DegT/DnrJ/EryC1/StrS family aminotransferase [Armatimonadota bacterium]